MSGAALAALDYARRGWRVFPCHSPVGAACSCGAGGGCASPAKHPRTRHGLHDASAEETDVRRWWRRWPDANVGLRTGAGLVVLDVDPAHGGTTSLAALEAAIGPLPETMTVRTGGGGLHLYFSHPGPVRNSAGALGPGLDVRGEGGYVIAPPSWHVSGAPYRWSASASLAPLPARLLDRLTPPPLPRRGMDMAVRPGPQASAWAGAALAGEVDRVVTAPVGQRNHTLNRAAFVLGQIVGAGHLDADEVADLLGRAGEACGLGAQETAATVASGLVAGQRWPRHPPRRPAPVAARPGRARPDASPEAARTLDAFVDQCARRLHGDDGTGVRRWLDGRGLGDDVQSINRIGADPGAHLQPRPAGVPSAGPAVVVPVLESGRVVSVQLRPLHPGVGGQVLTPSGAAPSVALVRPVAEAGPCVLVARGMLEALAACSAGYRAAALLHPEPPASSAVWDDVAKWLSDLGAPVAVALGPAPTAELRRALHQRGVAAAAVHMPRGDDLSSWMAESPDWRRELSAGLRAAWTCEHQARRVAR